MSDLGGWCTVDEHATFIRLERWLKSICGKVGLSTEEQLAGTVLIMDHRRALGLPLLAQPGEKRPTPEEIEASRLGLHLVPK